MKKTIQPAYITFNQAKLLKEKGFDGIEIDYGLNQILNNSNPPEQWQVVEWLRVNYGIWINVDAVGENMDECRFVCFRNYKEKVAEYAKIIKDWDYNGRYENPQDALSAAFDYVLKNLI
jgi:hypothetical protein